MYLCARNRANIRFTYGDAQAFIYGLQQVVSPLLSLHFNRRPKQTLYLLHNHWVYLLNG